MATPEEIRAELRAEERDDYRGTPPSYYVHRQGQVVGFVLYDSATEQWRYGRSVRESSALPGVTPEQAVDAALDRMAADLADDHDEDPGRFL